MFEKFHWLIVFPNSKGPGSLMNANLLNYSNLINSGQYGISMPNFDMGQGGSGNQLGGLGSQLGPGSQIGGSGSQIGGSGSQLGGPGSLLGGSGSLLGGPGSQLGGQAKAFNKKEPDVKYQ